MLAPEQIRREFPLFQHHPELVYLDNAATTQKPSNVIEGIRGFYEKDYGTVHRGLYDLAGSASARYEAVRQKVVTYVGMKDARQVVFTSGATAAINLVAHSYLMPRLKKGDEILISALEHHANWIPWQQIGHKTGAQLRIIPLDKAGNLSFSAFRQMLNAQTKLLAITHISNVLGTINPVPDMVELAHQHGVPVLVDGAQSAAHYPIHLDDWGVDFFVFSAHKLYGPTGLGVLCAKFQHLQEMQPLFTGGAMVRAVSLEQTTFAAPPQRFEAGTPPIAAVIGLGHALDFLNGIDKAMALAQLNDLNQYALELLSKINGWQRVGQPHQSSALFSFVLDGIHPHDIATFLAAANIAVRAGHHCAQPLMRELDLPATTRVSLALYNTRQDMDRLAEALKELIKFWS
ncbi:MAG TPA: SufS family cysteine desulfurase [Saprospiraceae bacterium]|nr:SufS family cysteine desulfurase [Saprospiraceae bacterium]HMQ83987.1 SufS family cysteine desulfurase [Saprospiraceae bacterium]